MATRCEEIESNREVSMIGESESIKYHYVVYGLNIISDFPLPELTLSANLCNPLEATGIDEPVHIVRSDLSDLADSYCEMLKNDEHQFYLEINNVARYFATHGSEIRIQVFPAAHAQEVRLFLLGTVLGMVLHQRGVLPMHASALSVDDSCILFTGASGAGKSTTAGLLNQRGFSILADDVTAITQDSATQSRAWPGFPRLKLWQDAIDSLDKRDSVKIPDHVRLNKFHLMVDDFNYQQKPLRVSRIYELHDWDSIHNRGLPGSKSDIQIRQVSGHEAMAVLLRNTYRMEILDNNQLCAANFKRCALLANTVNVFQIFRKKHFQQSEQFVDSLLKHIHN